MEDHESSSSTAVGDESDEPDSSVSPAKNPAKSTKEKAERPKASHPPTSEMVTAAINGLKDRKGSSLQAIKKYIVTAYGVDGEKLAPFIKRYLKNAVTTGAIVQTKGKGATGSFKLPQTKAEAKPKPRAAKEEGSSNADEKLNEKQTTRKPAATKKMPTKKAAPKHVSPKKSRAAAAAAAAPDNEVKAATSKKQPKTLSKTKKSAKPPAAKTRTPKPKKAAAAKVAKAAAKQ